MFFSWIKSSLFGSQRSSKWPERRARHLLVEPDCQSCGAKDDLEVHHIKPVHAGGEELPESDEDLITLCRQCHFVVAHAGNWSWWRPDVRRLAKTLREATVWKK